MLNLPVPRANSTHYSKYIGERRVAKWDNISRLCSPSEPTSNWKLDIEFPLLQSSMSIRCQWSPRITLADFEINWRRIEPAPQETMKSKLIQLLSAVDREKINLFWSCTKPNQTADDTSHLRALPINHKETSIITVTPLLELQDEEEAGESPMRSDHL